MILDQLSNIENYLGISTDLDQALKALKAMNQKEIQPGAVIPVSEGATIRSMTAVFQPKKMQFEFHRRYIDIHCPLDGTEEIGICGIEDCPIDAPFDVEKDIGFFEGEAANIVRVPAGWFCITFPQDAHCPGMSRGVQTVRKVVAKVLYQAKQS